MQVVVKKGFRPENSRVMSYAEERAAEERIKDLEAEMMGKEVRQGLTYQPKDIQTVEKWLAHYKQLKASRGAVRLEGKERVQAEVELRRIEDRIRVIWGGKIPSFQEIWITPRAGIDYLNLVNKFVELGKNREFHELVRRWKSIRRQMEPSDPNADNILHLYDRKRG